MTPPLKKSKLFSERIGLTNQMLGIDTIMCDVLKPYKIVVERLQTSIFPIGHNIRHWIRHGSYLDSGFYGSNQHY